MKKRLALLSVILVLMIVVSVFLAACDPAGNPDALGIKDMNVGERIVTGLLVFVMGLGMVFVVLYVLILIIKAIAALQSLPAKIAAKKTKNAPVAEPAKEIPAPVVAASDDEDEVVAAITAAIAAYYGAQAVETSDLPFRVRSIREIK